MRTMTMTKMMIRCGVGVCVLDVCDGGDVLHGDDLGNVDGVDLMHFQWHSKLDQNDATNEIEFN